MGESSEKQTPYFGIEFELESGESIDHVFYLTDTKVKQGNKEVSLKDKQLETLLRMGFIASKITDIADESKSIDDLFGPITDPINLVVAHEEFTTDDGEIKKSAKVKYVNVGYKSNITKFDHKQAVAKFSGLNLDGNMMSLRKNMKTSGGIPF